MKSKIFLFFFLVTCNIAPLKAVIFDSCKTTDILPYITENTVIIFDLDDTVFRMPSMLGNDAWFQHHVDLKRTKGLTYNESTQDVLLTYLLLQYFSELELIDEKTTELITDLQRQQLPVMALTTRCLALAEHTKKELHRLGVHFSFSCPWPHDIDLGITHASKYTDGIIFGANNHKGKLLNQFFEKTDFWPKKVIFLNDKLSNLKPVEEQMEKIGIEFVGLRYAAEDDRKKQFDAQVAESLLYEYKKKLGIVPLIRPEK